MRTIVVRRQPRSTLLPYTTLFRSSNDLAGQQRAVQLGSSRTPAPHLGDAVQHSPGSPSICGVGGRSTLTRDMLIRSEEHTSELQSLAYLVCRLLLEKKNASI